MKYVYFLILFLVGSYCFSNELGVNALMIKEKLPLVYEAIKSRAQDKWENDPSMVVYSVNKQSSGFLKFVSDLMYLSDRDKEIYMLALYKWSDGGAASIIEAKNPYLVSVDWVMVIYEIKKQIKAINQL